MKNVKSKKKGDVYIVKRPGDSYYVCSYRAKIRDERGNIRTVQRMLSTQTADRVVAQKRANQKREEDVARFHDNKQGATVNLRDHCPTCGQVVDLYLKHSRNKSTREVARDFLTVVAEGAMILGDEAGREKAREMRVSQLTAKHMLHWRNQDARRQARHEPRTDANINYYMRSAKSVFSRRGMEAYRHLNLPLAVLKSWREEISFCRITKEVGYTQLNPDVLRRMDRRAEKYFLRLAKWFERHGNARGIIWQPGRATHFANQYRNAHATYWLMRRCGLRNTEVANLRWEWFKPDAKGGMWLHLNDVGYWRPKYKQGKVPVARELYDELVHLFGPVRSGQDGFVLLGCKGHRDHGVHRACSKFCRKYIPKDRKKSAYELRKQYGSEMVRLHGLEKTCKLLRNGRDTAWKHYVDIDLDGVAPL